MNAAPNVIWICVDALRFDAIEAEPDARLLAAWDASLPARRKTPALNILAGESCWFNRCYTSAPYTTNAHAGAFTGEWPWTHGLRALWSAGRIPADRPTLPERLRAAGYATLSASGMPHIFHDAPYGFGRGFDRTVDLSTHLLNRNFQDMLSFIDGAGGKPFFLFYHATSVHDYMTEAAWKKFAPGPVEDADAFYREARRPAQARGAAQMKAYVDAVNFFDRNELARLLAWLDERGLRETTFVALFGDHGEPHPYSLREEEVRVPLLFRGAGMRAGAVSAPVRLLDLFATTLRAAGLPWPDDVPSTDLAAFGRGAPPLENYFEFVPAREKSAQPDERPALRGAVDGTRKLVRDASRGLWQACDLAADPQERAEWAAEPPAEFAALRARLEAIEAEDRASSAAEPSEDVVRRLRQLGYLD